MMIFEVAIEGKKWQFADFSVAKAKYNDLLEEGFWEVTMRAIEDKTILIFNRSAQCFFPTK